MAPYSSQDISEMVQDGPAGSLASVLSELEAIGYIPGRVQFTVVSGLAYPVDGNVQKLVDDLSGRSHITIDRAVLGLHKDEHYAVAILPQEAEVHGYAIFPGECQEILEVFARYGWSTREEMLD